MSEWNQLVLEARFKARTGDLEGSRRLYAQANEMLLRIQETLLADERAVENLTEMDGE